MRIDTLTVQNFKKFVEATCDLHPQYTLLIGENGSGKTSILDALAVALGVWLVEPPDTKLIGSGRNIVSSEIRLEAFQTGDRVLFREYRPVMVSATGQIGDHRDLTWVRQIRETGRRTTNSDAKDALTTIKDTYRRDKEGKKVLCPVIAYYGAGRAWLPSNERTSNGKFNNLARRWAAFYDCLNERIRLNDLQVWFKNELLASAHGGRMRSGFEIVRWAVVSCVPGADDLRFDPDRAQIVLSIDGYSQPFDNLSAGQRMMLALVADIAIKAISQNTYLVPDGELEALGNEPPQVLRQTPGVVLIDEIDVHLHPRWQRRVASDLKRTFPSIQFVCTSHSPQVIGEAQPEEIRLLDSLRPPNQSFGMDSNWILKVLMGADEQDVQVKQQLTEVFRFIAEKQFEKADAGVQELRSKIGNSQEIQRAASTIERVKVLGR